MIADIIVMAQGYRRKCRCSYCGGPMKKRMASNDPAYCTYECGTNGQPAKAKDTIGHVRGGNVV